MISTGQAIRFSIYKYLIVAITPFLAFIYIVLFYLSKISENVLFQVASTVTFYMAFITIPVSFFLFIAISFIVPVEDARIRITFDKKAIIYLKKIQLILALMASLFLFTNYNLFNTIFKIIEVRDEFGYVAIGVSVFLFIIIYCIEEAFYWFLEVYLSFWVKRKNYRILSIILLVAIDIIAFIIYQYIIDYHHNPDFDIDMLTYFMPFFTPLLLYEFLIVYNRLFYVPKKLKN